MPQFEWALAIVEYIRPRLGDGIWVEIILLWGRSQPLHFSFVWEAVICSHKQVLTDGIRYNTALRFADSTE